MFFNAVFYGLNHKAEGKNSTILTQAKSVRSIFSPTENLKEAVIMLHEEHHWECPVNASTPFLKVYVLCYQTTFRSCLKLIALCLVISCVTKGDFEWAGKDWLPGRLV